MNDVEKSYLILRKLTDFAKAMGLELWVEHTCGVMTPNLRFVDPSDGCYWGLTLYVDEVDDADATVNHIQEFVMERVAENVEVTM